MALKNHIKPPQSSRLCCTLSLVNQGLKKKKKGVIQVKFLERRIMGIPPLPQLLLFDSDGNHSNEQIMGKLLKVQAERRMKVENQKIMPKKKVRQVRCRRPRTRSVLMKRRARHECWRRAMNPMEKKVKTLKKLIPNSESRGLDGLFRETAEYILSLQMRVRVMQIMVKVLTGRNDE